MIPEDTLDFHTQGLLTPEQIRIITEEFLLHSQASGLTCVLIITGRGLHSGSTGTARKTVLDVLRKTVLKLEFRNADSTEGGEGAFMVKFKD